MVNNRDCCTRWLEATTSIETLYSYKSGIFSEENDLEFIHTLAPRLWYTESRMKKIVLGLTLLILAGCATGPTIPPELPISIQLKGTAVEVQNFIEQNISNTHGKRAKDLRITNADNRSITFQTDCMKVESYGAVSCTLIKTVVGNTGWDGPFLTIT